MLYLYVNINKYPLKIMYKIRIDYLEKTVYNKIIGNEHSYANAYYPLLKSFHKRRRQVIAAAFYLRKYGFKVFSLPQAEKTPPYIAVFKMGTFLKAN